MTDFPVLPILANSSAVLRDYVHIVRDGSWGSIEGLGGAGGG